MLELILQYLNVEPSTLGQGEPSSQKAIGGRKAAIQALPRVCQAVK